MSLNSKVFNQMPDLNGMKSPATLNYVPFVDDLNRINLDSKTSALVEKVTNFSGEVSRLMTSAYSQNIMPSVEKFKDATADIADKLNFSEESINVLQNSVSKLNDQDILQFAANSPMTNGVDIGGAQTSAFLPFLVQEVGTQVDQRSVLSTVLTDKICPTFTVQLDRLAPNLGIAPETYGDSTPIFRTPLLDSKVQEYSAGSWGVACEISPSKMNYSRQLGGGNAGLATRGFGQMIAYNQVNLLTQCLVRKNYTMYQAVFNNGFSYGGRTISSNIPTENNLIINPMGVLNVDGSVTYNTTNPIYTPLIELTNILNNPVFIKYRPYIKGILMNAADLQAIMNHPNVKSVTNWTNASREKLSEIVPNLTSSVIGYYAPGFTYPLIGDAGGWLSTDKVWNWYIPRGKMFIMLDFPDMGAYHLTINEFDPANAMPGATPTCGLFSAMFNRNLTNSENSNKVILVSTLAGAPALYRTEAFFTIDGLYSNVSALDFRTGRAA